MKLIYYIFTFIIFLSPYNNHLHSAITGFTPNATNAPPTPLNLNDGGLTNNTFIYLFEEKTTQLTSDLHVNYLNPQVGDTYDGSDPTTNQGIISAGTHVRSYYGHAQSTSETSFITFLGSFSISLNEKIVGIIGSTTFLDASNSVFGISGITYPSQPPSSQFYGLDGGVGIDYVSINTGNEVSLSFNNSLYSENFRIITQVPEPSTYLIIVSFLAGISALMVFKKHPLSSS